jgi:septal ring factor EnvC (AmiA/AmiB activator)
MLKSYLRSFSKNTRRPPIFNPLLVTIQSQPGKEEFMSDVKESQSHLLIVVLSITVLMVLVYFQQSQQWNRDLKSRDQKIGELGQKITEQAQDLVQARKTISGHEASSQRTAEELKTAQQIIGEMEARNQKNQKELEALKSALQSKDREIAELSAGLSEIKASTGQEMAAVKGRTAELEKRVADQARQLAEARENIQRLEASEKALQEKLQGIDPANTGLETEDQRQLDEQAAPKNQN